MDLHWTAFGVVGAWKSFVVDWVLVRAGFKIDFVSSTHDLVLVDLGVVKSESETLK
jgi:hypothetical protein